MIENSLVTLLTGLIVFLAGVITGLIIYPKPKCPANHLGYLATRPENAPVPEECLICPKVLDCVLKTSDS